MRLFVSAAVSMMTEGNQHRFTAAVPSKRRGQRCLFSSCFSVPWPRHELEVRVSQGGDRLPTFLDLRSADVVHSFWVPRLAGKTDLIPNKVNSMWIEPERTGLFLGQGAKYCGTQHAKMLLRVYVETREDFDRWVKEQEKLAENSPNAAGGRLG